MVGPNVLRTTKVSQLPGDLTYVDEPDGARGLRPLHEVHFQILELEKKQEQVRERISEAFYEKMFLMISRSDRREITAREIEERASEKMLALGPLLEGLNQDLLDPLIDLTFEHMFRQGIIPDPPEELQGIQMRVEYVSIMAQAQKLAGIAGIERFAGFAASIAQIDPQVMDKIDRDQMIDEYGDITGVPPRIIVPDDVVAAMRDQRAQAQQAQAAIETAQAGAKATKDLANAPMDRDSALSRLLQASQAGQV
jgi:hypothetical protein